MKAEPVNVDKPLIPIRIRIVVPEVQSSIMRNQPALSYCSDLEFVWLINVTVVVQQFWF